MIVVKLKREKMEKKETMETLFLGKGYFLSFVLVFRKKVLLLHKQKVRPEKCGFIIKLRPEKCR